MYSPWIEEKQTTSGRITGTVPPPRFQHVAVAMNDSIYIVGGTNGKTFFEEIYQYEPQKHHWTCYKPHEKKNECKDTGRARHSVIPYKGSMYLFGGIWNCFEYRPRVEKA